MISCLDRALYGMIFFFFTLSQPRAKIILIHLNSSI
nr:MAG TPA_asm: hypothetical protein [Caudoviricetes sp.]